MQRLLLLNRRLLEQRNSSRHVSRAAFSSPPWKYGSNKEHTGVKANYDPAMRFVAYAEVAVFARVLFGALLLRNSLLAPLFYAHFLRLRFYMSSFTRGAFQHVGSILDGYTQHPSCPPAVRRGYLMLTDLVSCVHWRLYLCMLQADVNLSRQISRYASTVMPVQNQGAGAAGGGAAAAAPNAAGAGAARR